MMRMKSLFMLIALLVLPCTNMRSQIQNIGNEKLIENILKSDKEYKLIYVFCNYCQASQVRYPKVVKSIQDNKNIAAYFICAQDSSEIADYVDTCQVKSTMYLIDQNRKRKLISFYNPIKAACKFLKKNLHINSDKMGASDFCILDKENKIIVQTNWDMKDEEYFKLLDSTPKSKN